MGALHRLREQVKETVEDPALFLAELAVDAGDHFAGRDAGRVPGGRRQFGLPPQSADELAEPLSRGGAFLPPGLAAAGLRQLLGDFREVDL